jgi:hypothetical protein
MKEGSAVKYKDSSLGFSFELPEGWKHDEHNLTLTFFGPDGRIGHMAELIQMQIGTILPQYHDPDSREQFMAEPGAHVSRSKLGKETNVVVLKKPSNTEITAVHDGVQYSIAHTNDSPTLKTIEKIKNTFAFPSIKEALEAIQHSANPQKQAIMRALKSASPEQARKELSDAEMPPVIERPGYTTHHVGPESSDRHYDRNVELKKWWRFWK